MTERLDRIERILDNLATNQINERESRLSLREDLEILYQVVRQSGENTDRAINHLTEQVNNLAEQVNNLAEQVDSLTGRVDNLTGAVEHLVENAQQDREQMRIMQAEIEQIWEYLMGQKTNGYGGDR
jgi:peptidoglycan hydrolase CwlO-like protein